MIRVNILISIRHLLKSKVFTFINVLGLSVAITATFLILQYVDFETSYDDFHDNKDQLYRVAYKHFENGSVKNGAAKNFMGLGHWINDQFPEVNHCTRFWRIPANSGFLIQHNGKIFNEAGTILVADSTFFQVFPSLLLKGNPEYALKDNHSLVLSERAAKKIFGREDPLGKVIPASDYNTSYVVTGIMQDIPENSHLKADFITRQDYSWDATENYWQGPWRYTYVTLKEKYDYKLFEQKLNESVQSLAKDHPKVKNVQLVLQPVTTIHLQSHFEDELKANGNELLIYLLLAIAFVILLMAWINYINIETSRFMARSKEISIRKIVGSGRLSLAVQFMIEYIMVTFLATCLAFAWISILAPKFTYLTGIPINNITIAQPQLFIIALGLFVAGSIFVGIYPLFLLPRINLVAALKGKVMTTSRVGVWHKSLIVFQFISSIVLIAFVTILYTQLEFMQQADRKVNLKNVITIKNPTAYSKQEERDGGKGGYENITVLKNKLLQYPGIASVSSSSAIPGTEIGFTYVDLLKRNVGDAYDPTRYKLLFIDYSFIPLYDLTLKAGRNFSPESGDDENWSTIILNEKAIQSLGYGTTAEALDQEVNFMVDDVWEKYKIVGIVEDYHHEALKEEIHPTIFFLNHNRGQQVYYSVKLSGEGDVKGTISFIEKKWSEIFPGKPMNYFFIDEYYDQQFKSELHFGRIFNLFAGVAIFIACLGILGMTLFEVQLRTKEVSIRKVLGASVSEVVLLLSKNTFILVVLASLVAIPIIYFISNTWLSNYPIRIEVSIWFFIVPTVVVLLIVTMATSFQTIKAAQVNPVDNLRSE